MHLIKEFEIAKSIHELMTSRSINGRSDFDALDATIASASSTPFCASSPWSGMSGHLANPLRTQVMSPSSAPMSATGISRTITTRQSPPLRMLTYLDILEIQAAASIQEQAYINRLGSLGNGLTNVVADFDSVDSRKNDWRCLRKWVFPFSKWHRSQSSP